MSFDDAFAEIRRFWPGGLPFEFGRGQAAGRLTDEFKQALPAELVTYLDVIAPVQDVYFDTVGNPLRLYGLESLGARQPGYNWNPQQQVPIAGWNPAFFLLADEGADPIVLDLSQPAAGWYKLWHGAGSWQAGEAVADTLGQLLLCSAALHHALNAFEEEPIVDDARGFNLAPQAAAWLFPQMKQWAGPYYAAWCSGFDNA